MCNVHMHMPCQVHVEPLVPEEVLGKLDVGGVVGEDENAMVRCGTMQFDLMQYDEV